MFYPVDSLKRGGRFYLCWVADSWPLRFATITHRQLWSHDIRKICDDLMHVMTNESGRPTNRFSLRLSSQLMRGLVRLYQKKVTVFLGELCMLNAHVIKNTNKRWNIHEVVPRSSEPQRLQIEVIPQVFIQEEPEEQPIEQMIQNSANVVSNIQDITLRETTIPEPQPVHDGFGEENPEQAMQLLAEHTLEFMLQGEGSAIQHSGLELGDKSHDKSHDKTHDKSRMALEPQMERISEHDFSMLGRVTGEGVMPVGDIDKELLDIPEIPHPELPAPNQHQQMQVTEQDAIPQADIPREVTAVEPEPVEIELEELEETAQQPRRRRFRNRLIIDKRTQLHGDYIRARLASNTVELRCESGIDDVACVSASWDVYFGRPCHSGTQIRSNLGLDITRLFIRNLGVVGTRPLPDREMEEARVRPHRIQRSILERIEEVEEPTLYDGTRVPQPEQPTEIEISAVTGPRVSVTEPEIDVSQLPTQKIETLSQQAKKRAAEPEIETTPKKRKAMGFISFRLSQQLAAEAAALSLEAEKENLALEQMPPTKRPRRTTVLQETSQIEQDVPTGATAKETERSVTVMLQEAGLADIQHEPIEVEQPVTETSRRHRSESSETPLGSLDRTKVSLGDSEQTTDSKRFIRDQWGTEGTMVKILKCIKADFTPITVRNLISKGPVISGHGKIIAARCFTSMLKLKQHGFIKIIKNPETLEIEDVMLGPKFD